MDVNDLRSESDLSERNNDGSKYTQGSVALQCNRNKSYQDIGSIPLAKAEPTPVRPCAVIGPDRVVPPPASNDAFLKKGPVEPWPSPDNIYRRPPEYPHKLSNIQNPSRNISPRQTFQENMPRILVPPTYNAVRHSDEPNFNHIHERNTAISKNIKANMASEPKYCEVPYGINTVTNEHKNVRDSEIYVPSVNSSLTRAAPHGWPSSSVNMHAPRTYGAHELYQYPQYPSCASQRPTLIPMARPHRTIPEDPAYVYSDHYYQDASARFKPYPHVKERFSQPRFEYIANYPSHTFHPPAPLQPHKYDISKSGQSHPYPAYPHLKYLDNRLPEHTMEGYQRPPNQPSHYNIPYRSQIIHPTYAPGSGSQNKMHPYAPDVSVKSVASNKLPNDNSNKVFIDFENTRTKTYPIADNYFVNDMGRVHPAKNQMVMPNYSSIGMHSMPPQQYYRKDNPQLKPFEYMPHFRSFEHPLNSSTMMRHAPQFSPNTLAISPTDSNTSNDTSQTHGTSQEDFGYMSQSSTASVASVRSLDSGIYRFPNEYYKRYDFRYGPIVGSSPTMSRTDLNPSTANSKETKQKQIDVRQFLQMWNEGEDENSENNGTKEIVIQTGSSDLSSCPKHHASNQDQLYVLGLVNVPSEELSKYEHIQKISKLPENIKGYNSLELLNQFEEVIESSNTSSFKCNTKEYQKLSSKDISKKQFVEALPRPVSPLDVEAKISQSVIHKEVGCNFEIRPCSPKMLNVEVAAPVQNILGERVIEKVTNPLSIKVKSPTPTKPEENSNCHLITKQDNTFIINENPSCKMVKSPYATNNMDSVKTNYSLQDLEINSGVCLASLPRLDNEIELHFPEVNQQFINANKIDGVPLANNCPRTGPEAIASDNQFDKMDMENGNKVQIADESGKTFTKLSKFRKLKTISADHADNNQLSKAVRTDSVIIKNPENIKNIEDKLLECSYNIPMNLSSHKSVSHESCNLDFQDKLHEDNNVDMALDFSINKSVNGLPIIDEENNDSIKPLQTKMGNILFENEALPSTIESKEPMLKNTESETNTVTCMQNNEHAIKNYENEFNEDTTKSAVVNCNDKTSDNACNAVTTPSTNVHLDVGYDTVHINTDNNPHISEVLETCHGKDYVSSPVKQPCMQNYDSNITISKENIFSDDEQNVSEDFASETDPIPKSVIDANDVDGREMMELLSSENDGIHLMNDNEDNFRRYKDEFISSENKNDFENDEISAKLEKLFQENDEDITTENENKELLQSHQNNLNVSVGISVKTGSRQSKELYSPRIQKLLVHTEGLCFYNRNKVVQEEVTKATSDDQLYSTSPAPSNAGMKTEEWPNNLTNDQSNVSLDQPPANKICVQKTTKDFISDPEFQAGPEKLKCQYNSVEHLSLNITEDGSLKLSENEAPRIIKIQIPEKTDFANPDVSYSKNIKERIRDTTEWEKQMSESDKIETNYDTVKIPHISNAKEKCELVLESTTSTEESCEKNTRDKSISKLNIQEDLSAICIDNVSNCASSNSEDKKNANVCRYALIENVTINKDNQMYSDELDVNMADPSKNNSHMASLSKNITKNHTQIQADKTLDTNENIGDSSDANNVDAELDNNVKKCLKGHLENVSHNDSDDYFGQETTDQSIDIFNENALKCSHIIAVDTSEQENSISNIIPCVPEFYSSSQRVENEKSTGSTDEINEKRGSDLSADNMADVVIGIAFGDIKKNNAETACASASTNCHQTDNKLIEETSIDQVIQNIECNPVKASQSTLCNNIDNKSDNEVIRDTVNCKIEGLSISMCVESKTHQREENQNPSNLIHNEHSGNGEALHSNSITDKKCNGFEGEKLEASDCGNIVCEFDGQTRTCNKKSTGFVVKNNCRSKSHNIDSMNSVCYLKGEVQEDLLNNGVEDLYDTDTYDHSAKKTEENNNSNVSPKVKGTDCSDRKHNNKIKENLNTSDSKSIFNFVSSLHNTEENGDRDACELPTTSNYRKIDSENNNEGQGDANNLQDIGVSDITNNCPANQRQKKCSTVNSIEDKTLDSALGVGELTETINAGRIDHDENAQNYCNNFFTKNMPNIVPVDYPTYKTKVHLSHKIDIKNTNQNLCSNNLESTFDSFGNTSINIPNNTRSKTNSDNAHNNQCPEQLKDQNKGTVFNDIELDSNNDVNKNDIVTNVSNCESEKEQNEVYLCNTTNNADVKLIPSQEICDFNCESDKCEKEQNDAYLCNTTNNADDKVLLSPVICDFDYRVTHGDVHSKNQKSDLYSKDTLIKDYSLRRKCILKRSLSDSALNSYKSKDVADTQITENADRICPAKRQKMDIENSDQQIIDENLCNIIQNNNRRNSVSSFYNDANISFCILIDNDCIIAEENEDEKICFAEISEDCITAINTVTEDDAVGEIICSERNNIDFSESVILGYENEKSFQESWLDDVACVETVVSDDIDDNEDEIVCPHNSATNIEVSISESDELFANSGHTIGIDLMDEEGMISVSQVEDNYETPHMNLDKISYDNEFQQDTECPGFYGAVCVDKILSGSDSRECSPTPNQEPTLPTPGDANFKMPENILVQNIKKQNFDSGNDKNKSSVDINKTGHSSCHVTQEDTTQSCETSINSELCYKKHDDDVNYTISSSPEVTSTTSEEKSSSILLKITNYNGSRVSEINEVNHNNNKPRCKFTENKEYANSHGCFPKRPLLTKAAQKYIPPIKESIRDLKVKLTLPQQRLLKLKQLKLSRSETKPNKQTNALLTISKKPKPNFEDVLKSIDEVQIKMHKEKSKKPKNIVPKVVIKKNLNGSHYTSSSNKDAFNPDLTGRKWQPWVFLEKNHFIDKMAIRNKTKAIYNYRKNTYVLAETFQKYKSVCNNSTKFVIQQPKPGESSKGQLKYTIRLKHTY